MSEVMSSPGIRIPAIICW